MSHLIWQMLHSWSINFVLLTMLKVREEQIHFWFCWCFPPTGPMHLISALSLWAGTLRARPEGVLQLPDSTKWRTWIYEHKHTEQDIANTILRTAGQRRTWVTPYQEVQTSRSAPESNDAPKEWTRWEVLFRRLKTLNPRRKVKSVVIHIYPFCIPFSL